MPNQLTRMQLEEAVNAVVGHDINQWSGLRGRDVDTVSLREFSFDSLAILECGIYLEDHFGVSINPGQFQLSADATLPDLLDFINTQV